MRIKRIVILIGILAFLYGNAKSETTGELYILDTITNKILSPEKYFDHQYQPKDNVQSIFEDDDFDKDLHFQFLDFNQPRLYDDSGISIQFLPTYDFSNESDIEDYRMNKKLCTNCFRLFTIKFPFF